MAMTDVQPMTYDMNDDNKKRVECRNRPTISILSYTCACAVYTRRIKTIHPFTFANKLKKCKE